MSDELLAAVADFMCAAHAVDRPDAPTLSHEAASARIRTPLTDAGPTIFWVGSVDGVPVGLADVHLPEGENDDVATLRVTVDPRRRRKGYGTVLLGEVLPTLRENQRSIVTSRGVTVHAGGEWAAARGFAVVQRLILQTLIIDEVDPVLWQVAAPAGYRLEEWHGSAPDRLVESFAHARSAIRDMPTGESSYRIPDWDAERIRAEEKDWLERGFDYHVVVACTASDDVVGMTEMLMHPSQPDMGMQQYTAVAQEHRGHGLGRALKAAMMRRIRTQRPDITWITTGIAADNVHMSRVNLQLGYTTVQTLLTVEARLETLTAHLPPQGNDDPGHGSGAYGRPDDPV